MAEQQDYKVIVVRKDRLGGGQLLLAFVGGALAGAVAGVLLAPRSGKDTRAKMRGLAEDAKEKMAHLPRVIQEVGAAAREAFDQGMEHKASPHRK